MLSFDSVQTVSVWTVAAEAVFVPHNEQEGYQETLLIIDNSELFHSLFCASSFISLRLRP